MQQTQSLTDLEWAARLRAIVAPLERQLRQQTPGPYSATELSLLAAIYNHGQISLGELAARERLSAPTVSKVVSRLEDAGIVKHVPDSQDRRVIRVKVTAAGLRLIDTSRDRRNQWLADRMASLPPDERATLVAAIPVLEHLLGDAWAPRTSRSSVSA